MDNETHPRKSNTLINAVLVFMVVFIFAFILFIFFIYRLYNNFFIAFLLTEKIGDLCFIFQCSVKQSLDIYFCFI